MTTTIALPEGFTSVDEGKPHTAREDIPMVALRLSGSGGCPFEILTAKYMPTYRPLNPWQTVDLDAVTDSGNPVIAWAGKFAIPEGRIDATAAVPSDERPVLAVRRMGSGLRYEVMTARYRPDFRPLNPWLTLDGDAVTDSGSEIVAWWRDDRLLGMES